MARPGIKSTAGNTKKGVQMDALFFSSGNIKALTK